MRPASGVKGHDSLALPERLRAGDALASAPLDAPLAHIRRCTYRRLITLARRPEVLYEVECLYPDRSSPLPLGDLPSARVVCDTCQAAQIFRPDED